MKFPVAIHKDKNTDYGVIVPDFKGCHSWGETMDGALGNTVDAIELFVETAIEAGEPVHFAPSKIDDLRGHPVYASAVWAYVDIDPNKCFGNFRNASSGSR